ncbi:hypothetical protein BKA70DRAFT_1099445, partial [Coprinopsis sp. MPI-PUGE-AT-0042]
QATAMLVGSVKGTLSFQQQNSREPVIITGKLEQIAANTPHGFHVQYNGDLGNNCLNAGGHFNPFDVSHGAPSDKVRHVGDLGNIESDENEEAVVSIHDHIISLSGPSSIIGRTIVIHGGPDDFGRGGSGASIVNGNAGPRLSCGLIGTTYG